MSVIKLPNINRTIQANLTTLYIINPRPIDVGKVLNSDILNKVWYLTLEEINGTLYSKINPFVRLIAYLNEIITNKEILLDIQNDNPKIKNTVSIKDFIGNASDISRESPEIKFNQYLYDYLSDPSFELPKIKNKKDLVNFIITYENDFARFTVNRKTFLKDILGVDVSQILETPDQEDRLNINRIIETSDFTRLENLRSILTQDIFSADYDTVIEAEGIENQSVQRLLKIPDQDLEEFNRLIQTEDSNLNIINQIIKTRSFFEEEWPPPAESWANLVNQRVWKRRSVKMKEYDEENLEINRDIELEMSGQHNGGKFHQPIEDWTNLVNWGLWKSRSVELSRNKEIVRFNNFIIEDSDKIVEESNKTIRDFERALNYIKTAPHTSEEILLLIGYTADSIAFSYVTKLTGFLTEKIVNKILDWALTEIRNSKLYSKVTDYKVTKAILKAANSRIGERMKEITFYELPKTRSIIKDLIIKELYSARTKLSEEIALDSRLSPDTSDLIRRFYVGATQEMMWLDALSLLSTVNWLIDFIKIYSNVITLTTNDIWHSTYEKSINLNNKIGYSDFTVSTFLKELAGRINYKNTFIIKFKFPDFYYRKMFIDNKEGYKNKLHKFIQLANRTFSLPTIGIKWTTVTPNVPGTKFQVVTVSEEVEIKNTEQHIEFIDYSIPIYDGVYKYLHEIFEDYLKIIVGYPENNLSGFFAADMAIEVEVDLYHTTKPKDSKAKSKKIKMLFLPSSIEVPELSQESDDLLKVKLNGRIIHIKHFEEKGEIRNKEEIQKEIENNFYLIPEPPNIEDTD